MEVEKINTLVKKIIPLFMLVVILTAGSAEVRAQSSLYQFREFTVTLEKYPVAKNPYTTVRITLDGNGEYKRIIKGDGIEIEKRKDFRLTVKQLEMLYYNIMRNNFFELNSDYGTPENFRGNVIRITVKIDSQLHTVTMYDERYLAVDMVVDAILESVPKKYAEAFRKKFEPGEEKFQIKLE